MKINRKWTRQINLGGVAIGGGAPVSIQSMTKTPTADVKATVKQCAELTQAGCEIIRLAVPDEDAARALSKIRRAVKTPLVADIHFNHRLALIAIEEGMDGIRINPGNIGGPDRIAEIARAAASEKIPIRVGVNSGSIEQSILKNHGGPTPEALAESALACVNRIEDAGHNLIKISVKASSVADTIRAYELVSEMTDYPLHVGVTEAGPPMTAAVRSAIGIGHLLMEGIGDTIRVSATADPVLEVGIAREILQSLGLRRFGPTLVSCPTCGRCEIDVARIVEEVQKSIGNVRADIKIAIMGCSVNGPGEAREADVGLAGGKDSGVIFLKGRIVRKVKEDDLVGALVEELKKLA
jgi:(E)-4-hydroxy-3-methylbut-2-enyl-diphosphate synthase